MQPVATTDLSDAQVIVIATPLFARDGQRIAVVAGVLNLTRLDQIILQETGLGETGEAYLVGSDGAPVHVRHARGVPRRGLVRWDRPGARSRPTGKGSTTTTGACP